MRLQRHLSHLRNQPADKEAIGTNRHVFMCEHVLQIQSIDNGKDPLQQRFRDLESYVIVILRGRITILRHLQCVESEFRLQVRGRILGITNGVAIFCAQLRIMNRNGFVDRRVAVNVRDIVRKRSQRKGVLIGVLAFRQ